ncbi:sugar (glycoside-Pentoside-hexuronide) transporter [Enterobacter cloacae]|uniref:Sugar (Glycoside-Pentoside-hexuronide) transporter n=1 Tax=Enterobacter cloacae TaxID=550 RepID=A0A377M849_ENTCL|nr:sugar (glycoside-Pentoside-hexuronide) transporter [Enterobacter cloacae]
MDNNKLSVKEKIGYGMGRCRMQHHLRRPIMLFVNYFYTDIFGLAPALVGVLLLSVRVIDAVTDPIMGAIADRTRSKYGPVSSMAFVDCVPLCAIQYPDVHHARLEL